MPTLRIPSSRLQSKTAVFPLTTVQRALWQLGLPILDANAVVEYKKRAKSGMLWTAIRWLLLAMAALVSLICMGGQWHRALAVGTAAVFLATLFGWLVSRLDLQWATTTYTSYQSAQAVPSHVSAAADALLAAGVPQESIGVEYLKRDPILFVTDSEQFASKRYDLIIW